MKRLLKSAVLAALVAAAVAAGVAPARAAPVSFTGSFTGDNDVQLFSFTLAAAADVTLRTWSYAGGSNAAGNPIAAGGFDPIVSLFYGSGGPAILIGANDDGIGVATDPGSGQARDSLFDLPGLLAGIYTVALTQVANFANGPTLADGFLGAGEPGFGGRSGDWALDILGASSAVGLPEPATLTLALFALAAAGLAARPRSGASPGALRAAA